jgi:hypothetical protein
MIASSFRSLKGVGRGESWIKNSIPTPTPLCISYAHTHLTHGSRRRLASKLLRSRPWVKVTKAVLTIDAGS